MSQFSTLFIGMDGHKDTIAVAYVIQDHGAEVVCPTPAPHIVCQEYVRAVNEHYARLHQIECSAPSRTN